jgi:hypothetical protein
LALEAQTRQAKKNTNSLAMRDVLVMPDCFATSGPKCGVSADFSQHEAL